MPWAKEEPTELPDDDVRQHVLQVRVLELLRDIEPPPPASQGHVLRAEPATASAAASVSRPPRRAVPRSNSAPPYRDQRVPGGRPLPPNWSRLQPPSASCPSSLWDASVSGGRGVFSLGYPT